jgi:hypothetical protein
MANEHFPRRRCGLLGVLMVAGLLGGCASDRPANVVWTGHVVGQTLQTDPRRGDVKMYRAAGLRSLEGDPSVEVTRILVNQEDRILDPATFGAGVVRVEGTDAALWGACDVEGNWLYYFPERRKVDWVQQIIRVQRATDLKGREIRLDVVKHPVPMEADRMK